MFPTCIFKHRQSQNNLHQRQCIDFEGGHLDFSHLTELENIYVTDIYIKKQYKPSIIKNHKTTKKIFFDGVTLKGYVAS